MTALREPAHRVSTRATAYWRVKSLAANGLWLVVLIVGLLALPYRGWYVVTSVTGLVIWALLRPIVMPPLRYRIHRWEVTDEAVYTRTGWLGFEERIAPINRVQTVDSSQGWIMRFFGLTSVTVTTASSAGNVEIECLDDDIAAQVVAHLTAVAAAAEDDAT